MKRLQKPKVFVKLKHLSRRKEMFLLGEVKKHVPWKRERDMHANLEAAINFKTLKITADPQIDIDYVKSMSVASIYDCDYRTPTQENISEDSVHIRPDIMHKLDDLSINDETEGSCNVNAPQQDIGADILQKTFFLHINDNNEL